MTKKSERIEAVVRIPVGIIAWIIMYLWGLLIVFLTIFHFFYTLITNRRNKELAEFSNLFIGHAFSTARYITFTTNNRPFPFNELYKSPEKVDMKKGN